MSSDRRRLILANQTEENLYLYGNSVQDGTPTPDAPKEIMSLENPTIKVTGNNLINNTLASQTINDVEVKVNDDKSITLNGTSSAISYLTLCTIEAIEGKFFLSGCPEGGSSTTYCLYLYAQREDGTRHYLYDLGNGKLVEMEEGLTYQVRISFNSVFDNLTIYPMLNKGTEALPYEPYEEELITNDGYTLRGIGDYKDRIYTKDGKVWYEQNLQSISLKDSNWYTYNTENCIVYSDKIDMKKGHFIQEGFCNIYSIHPKPSPITNDNSVTLGQENNSYLYIKDTVNATSQANYQEWIQTIDSEIIYPLATPIVTEITGALADKILAIDKTKNISVTSANGVSGNVEVIEE